MLRNAMMGERESNFPKKIEVVRFNVTSVTVGWVGVNKFSRKSVT